jgi:catechol 2,3-dioxygenase-like lactoylglutathione lyase family enzyme
MRSVGYVDDLEIGFLVFGDERDHGIAVAKVPDDQPVGNSGLSHTALEIDGGEAELRELYARLKSQDVNVEMTADHIISRRFYFLDPEGNWIELFAQVITPADGQQLIGGMKRLEDGFKPLDLEAVPAAG